MFCRDCILQYVESQVFGSGNLGIDKETKKPALELKCCEGGGCNSGFRDDNLKKILPQKTWEKYSELQAAAQIAQAGLGECSTCPKCGYQALIPETQMIFECPVVDCQFVSCKKCGKKAHIPLRCEEVRQQERQDEGRLKIEEALSEAKMRTCPKCKKKFIKSDGCNKMTCACGMKLCYVCRSPLDKINNPYSHFCQIPHCDHSSCGKCKLYSNDAEDDAQAMREAGIAAKEEFETRLKKENGGEVAGNVQLDVDQIMHDPSQPQQQQKPRPPQHQPRQQAMVVEQRRQRRQQQQPINRAMGVEQQLIFAHHQRRTIQQEVRRIQQRAQQIQRQHMQQQQPGVVNLIERGAQHRAIAQPQVQQFQPDARRRSNGRRRG